jgi:UV DNA damage endonuclease
MASDLAPYVTHPDWPDLHAQLTECRDELIEVGALARAQGLRLSFHAPSHVALASSEPVVVEQSITMLEVLAGLLDGMRLGLEAVIVIHSGGLAGGYDAAISRWVYAWDLLPDAVRRRLVLEHGDEGLTLPAALRLHAATGVPIVFDYLHFRLHNPERWDVADALEYALATWPDSVRPKVHFSSPRTEMRAVQRLDESSGRRRWVLSPPRPGHHADFLNPWEFASFATIGSGLRDFDVMLEAKAGDLALLHLRDDLARYVPDVYALLGPIGVEA